MTTILIRKGLNGFRYSACGEKGNFLFNANQIGRITGHWSKERRSNTVQFIRQLDLFPGEDVEAAELCGKAIGERLKDTRKKRGLTQKEVARMIEVSNRLYGDMERGKAVIPKHKLMILAVRLRENHKWLLTGEGERLS
ncbi:MAG: helix-turn-helix transcriptional regulator [Lachnospiraceae bacterium]|nr:helix-turn-helix transcriptional regulator [Lachnospiraceae bacterium]